MTNILKKAIKSKLQGLEITKNKDNSINPILTEKSSLHTFRLDPKSRLKLQQLLHRVNTLSERKISLTRLLKGLIQLGEVSQDKALIAALKETIV